MKNQTHDKGRRAILKGLVGIPVLAIAGFQSTSSYAAMLSADDPTAKVWPIQIRARRRVSPAPTVCFTRVVPPHPVHAQYSLAKM
jgi:hypothetical protein